MALWDPDMASTAAAIDHAVKMGGVVLKPPKQTGFAPKPEPPAEEAQWASTPRS